MASRHIASGAAGCVIEPAPPNGEREFPKNVAKIYVNGEPAAAKAVSMNEDLGRMGFRRLVFPYKRSWTKRNLPLEIVEPCGLKKKLPTAPIGMTHMPNLGVAFIDIQIAYWDSLDYTSITQKESEALIEKVRAVPFETILVNGIRPMLEAIMILHKYKKVHRDVRLDNTMFDYSTGRMTLIDFDLMVPREAMRGWSFPKRLMMAYTPEMMLWQSPEYSKPLDKPRDPEPARRDALIEILVDTGTTPYNEQDATIKNKLIGEFKPAIDVWKQQLELLVNLYSEQQERDSLDYLFVLFSKTRTDMLNFLFTQMSNYMDKLTEDEILISTERKEHMKIVSAPTVDSYCMAFCLMVFLGIYLDNEKWADNGLILDRLFGDVLVPLYKFNVYDNPDDSTQTRASIDKVLDIFDKLLLTVDENKIPYAGPEKASPSKYVVVKNMIQRNIREFFHPHGNRNGKRVESLEPRRLSFSSEGGTRKKLKSGRHTQKVRRTYRIRSNRHKNPQK